MWIYTAPVIIEAAPVAMGRPRFTRTGRVYVPQNTKQGVERIAAAFQGHKAIEGPISLKVTFVHVRPSRLNRKKDPVERIPKTTKPDIDNLLKTVMDGMTQGKAWQDDNQVCRVSCEDFYAAKGELPKTIIQIGVLK
jgi:Holliday junction resolvase RusA-like endonuclease